jgi:primosomal protein N' (replication factor Y)
LGEVALAGLPPQLRDLDGTQLARRLKRSGAEAAEAALATSLSLTPEQGEALSAIEGEPGPFLLFGATGSGKTEVYLQAVQRVLQREPQAQALVMVPEINLTPQLQARFVERFGAGNVVAMNSGMTPAQRLKSWLAAHSGAARIVLGTRMAVFASIPNLRLIVVDEEHDPSYKQQEGARYSARDLAVYRGKLEGAKVLLGSATPSLESWQSAEKGRYRRLLMASRVGSAASGEGSFPTVRLVDMNLQPKNTVFSPQ